MVEEMKSEMAEVTPLNRGDIVKGKVTKVEDHQVLVDVNYKFDGVVPISELSSLHVDKASDVLSEGDEVEVKVLRINDEEDKLVLSKKAVDADRAWEELQQKYESGETLEAEVADVVKGGLVVDLGVRGFIPASLVERHYVEDFSDYKGRTLPLKVIEIDPAKNKLILSRKAVLDEEAEQRKQEILASLEPGQVMEGTVQRLTDFGAFVDIGGVDGLVHVSELAWNRVEHPSEVISEGDQVQVKVLKVDQQNERISLSIKETQPGPWEKVSEEIKTGDIVTGTVKRLVSFGAFVEVYEGVEGLVHISQISRRHIATPSEELEEGQEVRVKVLDMQPEQKRISLSIKEVEQEETREEMKNLDRNNSGMNVTLGDVFGDQLRRLK
ncbi:30S ribosomal protein S1 [Kroppenstedtia guangzhouensis]|jgi:small subunit ribosomal protein S1|uniref:30S ribosomal protein S1 n=1 Tax=Kroppenstedtia guangzhouensis TaxID=1274356 RepID=A0ABQ1G8L3_9BACL|nr:30S ribosomal protein S1 [Kroppenstedtia guangzhouensis]GGA38874.1 30S ribosomal protein S1 [Kroppenstedtia guangzhouensis]